MTEVKLVITGDAARAVGAVNATDAALDKLGKTGADVAPRVVQPLQQIPAALAPIAPALAPIAPALSPLSPALKKVAEDAQKMGASVGVSAGQTAQAFRQLPAQLTDVATQLAGGQSPLLVLLQQGGQVKDAFGGIGPAARALATVFTPLRLAAGGVAAAIGAVALAAYQGRQESSDLARAMLLTGNYAGTSAGQFAAMAAGISASTRATIGTSRELLLATAATGSFGAQSIGSVTAAMARLQSISGASTQDVVADFAGMAKGVAAWAAGHNQAYAFITLAEWEHIRTLELQGKTEEAMALTADKLNAALKARQPALGTLQQAWKSLGEVASEAWNSMMGLGRAETLDEKIAATQEEVRKSEQRLADAKNSPVKTAGLGIEQRELGLLREKLGYLNEQHRMERRATEGKAAAAAEDRQAIADKASGKTDALANAGLDKRLTQSRNASAARLADLAMERQREDALHQLGLTGSQAAADARIAILQRETGERAADISRQINLERQRPTGGDPIKAAANAAKVLALEGQRAAAVAEGAKQVAAAQQAADASVLESARSKARQWADEWLRADAQVRALQDSTATTRIALIQDPEARARAETDKLIADKRRALETALPGLANSGNADKAAELAQATDEVIVALNDSLADRLKPGWQKQLDGWRDTTRLMKDSHNTMMDGLLRNAEDAWVQLATTGKFNVKSLVNSVIAEMARVQFRKFAANIGGGSLGGLLGTMGKLFGFVGGAGSAAGAAGSHLDAGSSLLMATVAHEGALVGTGEGRSRSLPASTWRGATRYHTGGLAGNEVPAILQRGEGVFTAGQMRAIGAGMQAGGSSAKPALTINMPLTANIDARSDQAQIAQIIGGVQADGEKRLWAQLRARGLA